MKTEGDASESLVENVEHCHTVYVSFNLLRLFHRRLVNYLLGKRFQEKPVSIKDAYYSFPASLFLQECNLKEAVKTQRMSKQTSEISFL